VKAVRNAFAVLEAVAEQQPVGVSDLARGLGLPKSTVQRAVNVLRELGWIRPSDGGFQTKWVLTTRALTVGGSVARNTDLRAAALPAMQRLAQQTGETIHLTIPDGRVMVLIDKIESDHAVRDVSWIGGRAPIHASASGKAVLAALPAAEVDAIFADRLERYTERTITEKRSLLAELEASRARGFAINTGEWRMDVAATGVALLDQNDRPVGALSISAPATRLSEELHDQHGELLKAVASQVTVPPGH
jgi:IclR family acetate operon transcriptional repressor